MSRDREVLKIRAELHPDLLIDGLIDCWINLHRTKTLFAVWMCGLGIRPARPLHMIAPPTPAVKV